MRSIYIENNRISLPESPPSSTSNAALANVHLQLDMLRPVNPMGEQDRTQVHIRVVSAFKRPQAVAREVLDPFGTGAIVDFWVRGELCAGWAVVAAHRPGWEEDVGLPGGRSFQNLGKMMGCRENSDRAR